MNPVDLQDMRVLERSARNHPKVKAATEKALEALPDMAEAVATPSAEDLVKLREDLVSETAARRERIVRFVEEAKAPPPPRPPVTPINEAEL